MDSLFWQNEKGSLKLVAGKTVVAGTVCMLIIRLNRKSNSLLGHDKTIRICILYLSVSLISLQGTPPIY
jgi:hypothetical protein